MSDTLARYQKRPEEICGELLEAFDRSVQAQLQEGEISPEERTAIVKVVDGTDLAIRDDIATVIRKLEDEEESCKAEGKRLAEFGKWRGALARRLKWSLLIYMQERGIRKVTGERSYFRVSKNPARLVIHEEILGDEWKKLTEPTFVPDKDKIMAALDSGQPVDGAYYEQLERLDCK